jgi:rhodanese-related sulfurtransferase
VFPDVPTVPARDVPDDAVLVDVREDDEWQAGHAPGARHVPVTQLMERYGEVPLDTEVHVVCRTGGRSARAVAWLNGQGFEAVNVGGGMDAWLEAGRPVVSENGEEPRVL